MNPVSVVIPTYNRAHFVPRVLASVLAAVEPQDEIILVDDGSTDDTAAVVGHPDAPWRGRVRYVPITNGGAGRARNTGVALAQHDLIAFADSDDGWLPYRLSLQRPLMARDPALAFCFSEFSLGHRDGRIEGSGLVTWSDDPRGWDEILGPGQAYSALAPLPAGLPAQRADPRVHQGSLYLRELHTNYINVNTLLVRRSVVGEALHFGLGLPTYEDWECFARIARAGPCAFLDIETAIQFGHDGPRLTQADERKRLESRLMVIERTWACDDDFIAAHGADLHRVRSGLLRRLARVHLRAGHPDEARRVLKGAGPAPIERAISLLPGALLRRIWSAR